MTHLQRRLPSFGLALSSGGLLAVLVAVSALSGCDSDPPANPGGKPASNKTSIAIESILDSLQPDEYDISVPRELPTTYLNTWGKDNLETLLSDDVDENALKEKLGALLSDEQIERVLRREFVIRDSAHFRDMIWARQLIAEKSVDDESELALMTRLFYHVVRTVRLLEDVESVIPYSPFEAMLYGRGTAADRAWIFSCLTRQLKLPMVLVDLGQGKAAADDSQAESSSPLIGGFVLNDKLHLYDFQFGLPIPSASCPADEPLPSIPATLAEVQSNDAILRALDVGDELLYPATASQFQQAKLLLAGESSVWARRVEAVKYEMSGTGSVPVVWEPLVAHGAFDDGGIFEIVTEALAGRVKPEAIGVWDYPEAQRIAREALTADQKAEMERIHEPMEAPRPYRQALNSKGPPKLEFGSGRQMQLRARVAQVIGRPQEAIPLYVRIQAWRNASPKADPKQEIDESLLEQAKQLPEDVLRMHSRAALEASFWQATCQLELDRISAASSTFEFWIRTSQSPELTGQAILLLAVSRALQGDLFFASQLLEKLPRENRYFRPAQILKKRWQAIESAE
jgi:hypothetical protein